jgi:hypothetical protein
VSLHNGTRQRFELCQRLLQQQLNLHLFIAPLCHRTEAAGVQREEGEFPLAAALVVAQHTLTSAVQVGRGNGLLTPLTAKEAQKRLLSEVFRQVWLYSMGYEPAQRVLAPFRFGQQRLLLVAHLAPLTQEISAGRK